MVTRCAVFVLALSSLIACDPLAPGSTGPDERGPLGKADSFGSCTDGDANLCGGKSAGACWCDDQCSSYGDCCEDYEPVCLAQHPPVQRTVEVIMTAPYCDECSAGDKAQLLEQSPVIAKVVALIDGADSRVEVAQYTFSRREIEQALVRAHQRGVRVRLAIDDAQDRSGTVASRLRDAGLEVRFVHGSGSGDYTGLQHAKFMIVDEATLVTGSNNWSSTGVSINCDRAGRR